METKASTEESKSTKTDIYTQHTPFYQPTEHFEAETSITFIKKII